MLNETQLLNYIATFYGYGNYDAPYWFVGMEEGGGTSLEEITQRLSIWSKRGQHELEHLAEYHLVLGVKQFFTEPVKLQSTWNKLMRMVMAAQNIQAEPELLRAYQSTRLGTPSDETCLLELLPLPSQSVGHWIYADSTHIPELVSRKDYREHYAPLRAEQLRRKVLEHRPKAVVFYSFDSWYMQWWQKIAGSAGKQFPLDNQTYYFAEDAYSRYFVVKHPVAMGVTNAYYEKIGRLISENA